MRVHIDKKDYVVDFEKQKDLIPPITDGHTLVTKKDGSLYYNEELVNNTQYVDPHLKEYSDVRIYNKKKAISPLSTNKVKPVFLSVHTTSYHHFLIDTIGAILFLKKNGMGYFDIKTIMSLPKLEDPDKMYASEKLYKEKNIKKFHNDIFKYFNLGNYEDTLINIQDAEYIDFEKVVTVNYPSAPLDSFYSILSTIKNYSNDNLETPNRKLYITRKSIQDEQKSREVSNDNLIQEFLKEYGYETVYLEDLSFFEQFTLLKNASDVIAYNGSSLVNTVFMQEKTRIIEIRNSSEQQHDAYLFWSKWFNRDHYVLRCFGVNTAEGIISVIKSDPQIIL